jgi:ATP-dependent exoDNAse (exonuclease V) beta subunit
MIHFFDEFKIDNNKRNEYEKKFSKLIELNLRDLCNVIPKELTSIIRIASFAGENCLKINPQSPISSLANITSIPGHQINDLNLWKAIAGLIYTKDGSVRQSVDKRTGFPPGKAQMKNDLFDFLEVISGHPIFLQKLRRVRDLPEPKFTNYEWQVLESTLLLLPDMAKTLRNVFSEQGKVDFTEISLTARKALGSEDNPTDLLLYLDYKIQHILVDEYQDISFKQYDLLKNLTSGWITGDGRTMFIVGDPMQSIYRFRDAEVGLFLKTKNEGLGQIHFDSLLLRTNFRSKKPVVDWINECFGLIFPKENDQYLGAIKFSRSSAEQNETTHSGIFLRPVDKEETEIANLILSLHEKHPDKTVAILVRARNHLKSIIKEFRDRKIKFQAEDIDSLTSRPEIMDLLALMRALTSLSDRVAWLSILRAPWCGLSLADLHKICDADKNTPIWKLLQDNKRIENLNATGQSRLRRIIPVLSKTLKSLPVTNFRDLLEGCWVQLGGPACANRDNLPDIEIFFEKVSDFIESNELSNIRVFQDDINHLFSNTEVELESNVQIMTMHKSKGLEFDFVIIPGLEKTSKAEKKRLVNWMPHGDDLLIAPIEEKGGPASNIYSFLSQFDRNKSDYETLRLLYVAATRTKLQLHLFGQFSTDGEVPPRGSLLNKLWPYIGKEWSQVSSSIVADKQNKQKLDNFSIPSINRLPENYHLPETLPSIELGGTIELQDEPESPEFVWAGSGARCLGIVMHKCFQTLAEEGQESWTEERIKTLETSMSAALKSQGLPPEMIPEEIKKGQTMLRNILGHDTGRWILESHRDARCEYSLTQMKNNIYQSRIIDRTFVDKNNVRWIIDYKTGTHMGANLETFFSHERERYHNQLNQYENLFRQLGETRSIKKALYYPMHKELLVF